MIRPHKKRKKKKTPKRLFKTIREWFQELFQGELEQHPDWILLGTAVVLLIIGLIVLTSASSAIGLKSFGSTYYFFKQQLFQGVTLGILGGAVMYKLSLGTIRKWSFYVFAASLVLLVLVLIPQLGDTRLGASRWLNLGPISFQPSEVVKFTFILYLASWLTKQQQVIKHFKETLVPFAMIIGVVAGLLMLQPDLGTTGIFVLIAMTMYFVAGGHVVHLGLLTISGLAVVWGLIKAAPYRAARLTTFLNPELDPQGLGYHINQALLAVGSGGLFGRGLGHSRQKFQYLPEVYGDSIFAIMAEELGFIVTVLIVSVFIYFFIRGFTIAKRVPSQFASLVVVGMVAWWGWQTIVNIGAMVGLLPLTGVPWPFVSYGSTALAINLTGLGLVLNISRYMK